MANERLPQRSIPDRSPGHAFVRMTRVGIYSSTNDTHETGPPKSEQLPGYAFDRRDDEIGEQWGITRAWMAGFAGRLSTRFWLGTSPQPYISLCRLSAVIARAMVVGVARPRRE